MRWLRILSLGLLLTGLAGAPNAAFAARGGGGGGGARGGFGGGRGAAGRAGVRNGARSRWNGIGNPYGGYPYGYGNGGYPNGGYANGDGVGYYDLDNGYGYEEPVEEPQAGPDGQAGMMPPMMPMPPRHARVPTAPKVVDVPAEAHEKPAKPVPAAVFVLNNGERIESSEYLLTFKKVEITSDHKERSIPLSAVDMNATLAANHERGLDLQIPKGGSEVSLGF